jgi:hypothetical protein
MGTNVIPQFSVEVDGHLDIVSVSYKSKHDYMSFACMSSPCRSP